MIFARTLNGVGLKIPVLDIRAEPLEITVNCTSSGHFGKFWPFKLKARAQYGKLVLVVVLVLQPEGRLLLLFGTEFQYSRKGDKMKRGKNAIRLPLETWCSLSDPQRLASNKG